MAPAPRGAYTTLIDRALAKRLPPPPGQPLQPLTLAAANAQRDAALRELPPLPRPPRLRTARQRATRPPRTDLQREARPPRNAEQRAARQEQSELLPVDEKAEAALEATHDASGSTIRANSRRLATLLPGAVRDEAKRDVDADIHRCVEVGIENQAACVQDYAKRANVQMLVCGGCGLRDPDDGEVRAGQPRAQPHMAVCQRGVFVCGGGGCVCVCAA